MRAAPLGMGVGKVFYEGGVKTSISGRAFQEVSTFWTAPLLPKGTENEGEDPQIFRPHHWFLPEEV